MNVEDKGYLETLLQRLVQQHADTALDDTCSKLVQAYLVDLPEKTQIVVTDDQLSSVVTLASAFIAAVCIRHIDEHGGECVPLLVHNITQTLAESVSVTLDLAVEDKRIESNPLDREKGWPYDKTS